jgi:hypothetical protein
MCIGKQRKILAHEKKDDRHEKSQPKTPPEKVMADSRKPMI